MNRVRFKKNSLNSKLTTITEPYATAMAIAFYKSFLFNGVPTF
ncbi:hypothetical protein [Chryseobacterium salviniae]|uniref:Uncharacterized protein n=1 Tax=Chryseobacterium salviniae TaxID=3101750 RepID=A0ABU6HMN2_9FLAO|nr:hypothetical protein [Chryseobacterium sp. T9W2-O]MEC3874320.1 hypothetical protein [Chryseobacterium sp. T9W2-O]